MRPHSITVAVQGGQELERAGLTALIASLPGLRVTPMTTNPSPQVLVWLISQDEAQCPPVSAQTALLMITDGTGYESFPDSVTGLFSRDESPSALGIAIRQVARGEQYLSPTLAATILGMRHNRSKLSESEKSLVDTLTEREREILSLLAQGLSNKLIASKVYLSVRTVEGHLANIYLRLGVHSRTEAMLLAMKIK